jgi:hypothetical protein
MFNATITGRLGTDPEMRYTDGGTPVVNVSIKRRPNRVFLAMMARGNCVVNRGKPYG